MKIAVLGTGMVGDTLGSKLVEPGHTVKMGSRTADNEKALAFVAKHTDGNRLGAPLKIGVTSTVTTTPARFILLDTSYSL